jgi:hypothetical protein
MDIKPNFAVVQEVARRAQPAIRTAKQLEIAPSQASACHNRKA